MNHFIGQEIEKVIRVEGLRRWSFTIDTIYLRVTTTDGTFAVSEDEPGYRELFEGLRTGLPGFEDGWGRFWEAMRADVERDVEITVWERPERIHTG